MCICCILICRLLRSWILKPLAFRPAIIRRQEAVQWFINHKKDARLIELKKVFKSLPDLEKRLTTIMHFRVQPKEFHALCRSWAQLSILCKDFHEDDCPSVRDLTDLIYQSLQFVPDDLLCQLKEEAVNSGDKTKLFLHITDYPAMAFLKEKIHLCESELQVCNLVFL